MLDLRAGQGEAVEHLRDGDREVDVVAEPAEREFHEREGTGSMPDFRRECSLMCVTGRYLTEMKECGYRVFLWKLSFSNVRNEFIARLPLTLEGKVAAFPVELKASGGAARRELLLGVSLRDEVG